MPIDDSFSLKNFNKTLFVNTITTSVDILRSDIAYYLVILYTLAICKPVLPFVQDKLAHFFWNNEHIATVHLHLGDQHAEHKASSASHEENNKKSANSKTIEFVSIHLIGQSVNSTPQSVNASAKADLRIYNVSSLSLDKPYPPPRFS